MFKNEPKIDITAFKNCKKTRGLLTKFSVSLLIKQVKIKRFHASTLTTFDESRNMSAFCVFLSINLSLFELWKRIFHHE